MRAKKLLTSRQIFRYAVPARTVTKKALPPSLAVASEVTTLWCYTDLFIIIIVIIIINSCCCSPCYSHVL